MRLDKFLSLRGISTRKESKKLLKKKIIRVNGEVVTSPNVKIEIGDIISYYDMEFVYQEFVYFLLNKPQNFVSATKDNLHPTVLELLDDEDFQTDLFPVGRLDIDTTGLLLITNDGKLSHQLLHPKHHVEKTYVANLKNEITKQQISRLEAGVYILDDYFTKPAKVEEVTPNQVKITISEGKFHQVKKMFEAVGNEVTELKRISFGNLVLPADLEMGDYLLLDREQIEF